MTDRKRKEPKRPASGAAAHEKSQGAHKPRRQRPRRRRCRATAKGTGGQCSKRAMPGVDYCRSHYPWKAKRPSLVVGAVAGVILALGLQFVCDALTTSKAEAKITRFEELTDSIYPGAEEQEALEKLREDRASLTSMVYRNVGMACQSWKNAYLVSRPDAAEDTNRCEGDACGMLDDTAPPKFSAGTWARYRPLFDQVIDECAGQLDEIIGTHGTLLAPEFKTLVMETKESFEVVQRTYTFARLMSDSANREPFFAYPFRETIRTVSKLARESERRQAELIRGTD